MYQAYSGTQCTQGPTSAGCHGNVSPLSTELGRKLLIYSSTKDQWKMLKMDVMFIMTL